jgi:hypothetical protein
MKKKFVYGMLVAFAIMLLYIFRKKIFIIAAKESTKPGNQNTLIYTKTDQNKALPGTEGAAIGKLIADYQAKKAETLGTQDDTVLDSRKFEVNKGKDIGTLPYPNIGQIAINRAIQYPKSNYFDVCDCCGTPVGGCGCGCPNQYDIQ